MNENLQTNKSTLVNLNIKVMIRDAEAEVPKTCIKNPQKTNKQ